MNLVGNVAFHPKRKRAKKLGGHEKSSKHRKAEELIQQVGITMQMRE